MTEGQADQIISLLKEILVNVQDVRNVKTEEERRAREEIERAEAYERRRMGD